MLTARSNERAVGVNVGALQEILMTKDELELANAQVVAKLGEYQFTRGELSAYFEVVQDKTNWKLPICTRVALKTERDRCGTQAAVMFYTGAQAEIHRVGRTSLFRVDAVGYYIAIGA